MNPYQDVIDWLRSPEGSQWSEQRMKEADARPAGRWNLNIYGCNCGPVFMGGVFSVKEQEG